jgi:hypothetical protein
MQRANETDRCACSEKNRRNDTRQRTAVSSDSERANCQRVFSKL